MKKFFKKSLTILGLSVIIGGVTSLFTSSLSVLDEQASVVSASELISDIQENTEYKDEYVFDIFEITEIVGDYEEIYGEIIGSSAWETEYATGEGIYLDDTFKEQLQGLNEDSVILVVYDAEDYMESIWDNILDVKILKK